MHGDNVAQYVINNAGRLGVMYVSWRQRTWDTRGSGDRRQLEDRGGVTADHFGHVPRIRLLSWRSSTSRASARDGPYHSR